MPLVCARNMIFLTLIIAMLIMPAIGKAEVAPKDSQATDGSGNKDCVYGLDASDPHSPDGSALIVGCKAALVGKYELTGDSATAWQEGGSIGGYIAYNPFGAPNPNSTDCWCNPSTWIPRIGLFITPSLSSTSSKTSNTGTGSSSSAGASLAVDFGFGLHFEIPKVPFGDNGTPLGLGIVYGWTYNGSKTDQYNGKPWVGFSVGTYF